MVGAVVVVLDVAMVVVVLDVALDVVVVLDVALVVVEVIVVVVDVALVVVVVDVTLVVVVVDVTVVLFASQSIISPVFRFVPLQTPVWQCASLQSKGAKRGWHFCSIEPQEKGVIIMDAHASKD